MATILMQTTITDVADDWNIDRFSLLADELRRAGHHVTARDRAATPDDPVLSALDTSAYDQLWLFAVDVADGLGPPTSPACCGSGREAVACSRHAITRTSVEPAPPRLARRVNHFHTLNPAPMTAATTRTTRTSRGPTTTRAPTATTSPSSWSNRCTTSCAPP